MVEGGDGVGVCLFVCLLGGCFPGFACNKFYSLCEQNGGADKFKKKRKEKVCTSLTKPDGL